MVGLRVAKFSSHDMYFTPASAEQEFDNDSKNNSVHCRIIVRSRHHRIVIWIGPAWMQEEVIIKFATSSVLPSLE
jgi:hypothetical protein